MGELFNLLTHKSFGPPNIPDSLSGPTLTGPRRGFPLESDGGLQIAPTLLVVVGLSERGLTIGFLVAPTSGGGGQLV